MTAPLAVAVTVCSAALSLHAEVCRITRSRTRAHSIHTFIHALAIDAASAYVTIEHTDAGHRLFTTAINAAHSTCTIRIFHTGIRTGVTLTNTALETPRIIDAGIRFDA